MSKRRLGNILTGAICYPDRLKYKQHPQQCTYPQCHGATATAQHYNWDCLDPRYKQYRDSYNTAIDQYISKLPKHTRIWKRTHCECLHHNPTFRNMGIAPLDPRLLQLRDHLNDTSTTPTHTILPLADQILIEPHLFTYETFTGHRYHQAYSDGSCL